MIGTFELLRSSICKSPSDLDLRKFLLIFFFQANSSDSEDDEEVGVARRPGASGKKVIQSSSDEDSDAGGSGTLSFITMSLNVFMAWVLAVSATDAKEMPDLVKTPWV